MTILGKYTPKGGIELQILPEKREIGAAAESEGISVKKGNKKAGTDQAPVILTIIPDWADAAAIGMLVGLSDRQIQNLTRSGVLTKETPPGRKVQKYRTCKAVQQYIAHVKQKAGEQGHPKDLTLRKLEAEVKLKESQGELASIKADIAGGRYIETAAAAQELTQFMDTFKAFAINIPSRVAGTVGSYTDAATARAIERATRKELEDMLALFVNAALPEYGEAEAG